MSSMNTYANVHMSLTIFQTWYQQIVHTNLSKCVFGSNVPLWSIVHVIPNHCQPMEGRTKSCSSCVVASDTMLKATTWRIAWMPSERAKDQIKRGKMRCWVNKCRRLNLHSNQMQAPSESVLDKKIIPVQVGPHSCTVRHLTMARAILGTICLNASGLSQSC